MRQNTLLIRLLLVFVAVMIFAMLAARYYDTVVLPGYREELSDIQRPISEIKLFTEVIQVGERNVTVLVADTPEEHKQGLSGRTGLGPDEGMLFVFQKDDLYGIWMKDMNFSIDIVWLSLTGKVITIEPNVSPRTYPRSFTPRAPARYVLELPAGYTQRHNVKVGDTIII